MKSFKKFFSVLLCLCLTVVLAFSCLACAPTETPDGPDGPGQNPTCNHNDKIFCDDCGKMVLGDEFFVNYVKSGWNTFGKGKALKYEIKDVEFELTPPANDDYYKIEYRTQNGYDYASIDKFSATVEECFVILGFDNNLAPYFDMSMRGTANAYISNSLFAKIEASTAMDLKGNTTTIKTSTISTYPGLSNALQELNNDKDEQSSTYELDEEERIPEEILYVFSTLEEGIIPMMTTLVDDNKESINDTLAEVFDSAFTVKKSGENYKFTNKDVGPVIKKLDGILSGTVSEAVDTILGEGTYAKLPQTIDDILGTTIQELVQEVEKSGKSLEEIIDMINEFIQAYLVPDSPDYDNVTIDDLIFGNGNMSILQFIQDNKDKTIKEFIIDMVQINEAQFDAEIENVKNAIAAYADMKIAEDILNIDGQTKTVISSIINDVSELIDDVIKMELVLDKDGNVVSCAAKLSIDSTNEHFFGLLDAFNVNLDLDFSGSLTMELTTINIPA